MFKSGTTRNGLLILLIATAGLIGVRCIFNTSPFFDCWPLDWLQQERIEHAPVPDDAVCYKVSRGKIYFQADAVPNWIVGTIALAVAGVGSVALSIFWKKGGRFPFGSR